MQDARIRDLNAEPVQCQELRADVRNREGLRELVGSLRFRNVVGALLQCVGLNVRITSVPGTTPPAGCASSLTSEETRELSLLVAGGIEGLTDCAPA